MSGKREWVAQESGRFHEGREAFRGLITEKRISFETESGEMVRGELGDGEKRGVT